MPREGEASNPYIGVFPLLAAVIGIRRYWRNLWVRYLAGLAVAAFLFSFGSYSWLHGVLYATVPELWNLREASRMVYLADFALAILAAHGVEALVVKSGEAGGGPAGWIGLNRTLLGIVIACAAALFVPAMFDKPDISPWNSLSILMIFASYGLFRYLEHGNRGGAVQAIMVGLILFDLSACDWIALNRIQVAKTGVDYLDLTMSARAAAQFLKAQPGIFRVLIQTDPPPNIGDLFRVPIVNVAGGATIPIDYSRIMGYTDLLNVRYVLTSASEQKPGAVRQRRRVSRQGLEGLRKSERLSARLDRARNHGRAFRGACRGAIGDARVRRPPNRRHRRSRNFGAARWTAPRNPPKSHRSRPTGWNWRWMPKAAACWC